MPEGLLGDGRWVPFDLARALAEYREAIAAGRPDAVLADLAWRAGTVAHDLAVRAVENGGRVTVKRGSVRLDDALKAGEAAALWFFGGELMGLARAHDARASAS